MIPLSYQSIGFTSIVIMVGCLVISELVRYIKGQLKKPTQKSGILEK
jgi:hypothetical protein